MPRYYGHEYEISVYVYLKVAMDKRTDEDEISEEAFNATCRLYEHDSFITEVDNETIGIEQDNKYFTVAEVRLDLRINTDGHSYEQAKRYAEAMAEEAKDRLPAGVAWYDCEAYDGERGDESVDWDWACGE